MSLSQRLMAVQERIAHACSRTGRTIQEVQLVAVSKRHPATAIDEAVALGQLDFGENYVQEAQEKFPRPPARLHFIGALQRNKVRKILGISTLIHGVASLSVLEAIDRVSGEEGHASQFLVQLHLTQEATKFGFSPDELPLVIERIAVLRHSACRGFMAMSAVGASPREVEKVFEQARLLRDTWQRQVPGLDWLSMGMSDDMEQAIGQGATHVRVGTAIFGERP